MVCLNDFLQYHTNSKQVNPVHHHQGAALHLQPLRVWYLVLFRLVDDAGHLVVILLPPRDQGANSGRDGCDFVSLFARDATVADNCSGYDAGHSSGGQQPKIDPLGASLDRQEGTV